MEMQGQPAPQAPQAADEGAGKEQLMEIAKGVSMAMEKIASSLSEEDAAAMAKVNQAYQAVISKAFGGQEESPEEAPAQGQTDAMGGPNGVPVGQ